MADWRSVTGGLDQGDCMGRGRGDRLLIVPDATALTDLYLIQALPGQLALMGSSASLARSSQRVSRLLGFS